jgi:hypothetical protein
VVDRAELLVALPGHVHLTVWIPGLQATSEFGLLPLRQVFDTMPQDPADLIERIVFVAAMPNLLLLDTATDLVNDLGT